MVNRVLLAVTSVLLLSAVAAGCVERSAKPRDYHAYGGPSGWFTVGFDYEGRRAQGFRGDLFIHANDVQDTGEAIVRGHMTKTGDEWVIRFDKFFESPGKTFQDGGIASNLHEHGATGIADTSIPEVLVDVAAWGEANITVNNRTLPDAITGEGTWLAHYMVIRTGVRDDATGRILNANRTGPYDPKAPRDGFANATDPEIHLVIRSHRTPDPNATHYATEPVMVNPPVNYLGVHDEFENPYVGTAATFYFNASATPSLQFTTLNFTLRDPAGLVVAQRELGGANQMSATAQVDLALERAGKYAVTVAGRGPGSYTIEAVYVPPPGVVFNFWWEDVVSGAEAERLEASLLASSDHGHR